MEKIKSISSPLGLMIPRLDPTLSLNVQDTDISVWNWQEKEMIIYKKSKIKCESKKLVSGYQSFMEPYQNHVIVRIMLIKKFVNQRHV